MNNCFYCENGDKLRSLMIEIAKTDTATVYLNRDQKHPARCIVALNSHKTEYHQMDEKERNSFFSVVAATGKAIETVFHPDKINYATFGDLVPHVHVHMVPKYKDGLQWGAPFDDSVPKKLLTEEEYNEMIEKIRSALIL